jgi:hypothetical protein
MATTNELFEILPEIMKNGEVPMLVGHAGVGKTEVIRAIGRKYNREVIVLALSQMEPGDLIGMPSREGNRTVWLQPEWWPQNGNTIIFLDEINRSHETVRAAIMQLLLDKRLNTHVLPEGTWLVAAMNPETDEYEVNMTIDQAYIDRFVWLKVINKFDEWKNFANANLGSKGRQYVMALDNVYKLESESFQMNSNFELPNIVPTPRAHFRVAKLYQNIDKQVWEKYGYEILQGTIGKKYASIIMKQLKELNEVSLTVEDILENRIDKIKHAKHQSRINAISQLVNYLIDNPELSNEQINNMVKSLKLFNKEELGVLIRSSYDNKEFRQIMNKLQNRNEELEKFIVELLVGSNIDDIDLEAFSKIL